MDDVVFIGGLTFAAVEIAKQAGLPGRYAGLAAVILGVIIACLAGYAGDPPSGALPEWIITGVVAGLSAAGVYSGARAATTSPQPRDEQGRFTSRNDGDA